MCIAKLVLKIYRDNDHGGQCMQVLDDFHLSCPTSSRFCQIPPGMATQSPHQTFLRWQQVERFILCLPPKQTLPHRHKVPLMMQSCPQSAAQCIRLLLTSMPLLQRPLGFNLHLVLSHHKVQPSRVDVLHCMAANPCTLSSFEGTNTFMQCLRCMQEAEASPSSQAGGWQRNSCLMPLAEHRDLSTQQASHAGSQASSAPRGLTQPTSALSSPDQPRSPLESQLTASPSSQPAPAPLNPPDAVNRVSFPPTQKSVPAVQQLITQQASHAQSHAPVLWCLSQPTPLLSSPDQPASPLDRKLEAFPSSQPAPSALNSQNAANGMLLPPAQTSVPAAVQLQQSFPNAAQHARASETQSQADDAYSMLFESDTSSITSAAGLQKVCPILYLLP